MAATFRILGFAEPTAQLAAPILLSSHPKTKNTIRASLPWKVWTVPILVTFPFSSYRVNPIFLSSCDKQ